MTNTLSPGEPAPPSLAERLRACAISLSSPASSVCRLLLEAADEIERPTPSIALVASADIGKDGAVTVWPLDALPGHILSAGTVADEVDASTRPIPGVSIPELRAQLHGDARTRRVIVATMPSKTGPGIDRRAEGRRAIIDWLIEASRAGTIRFLGPYRDGEPDGGAALFPDRFEVEGTIDLAALIDAFALAASGIENAAERLRIAESECAALAESNAQLRKLAYSRGRRA